jgi:predicted RNase H-like nuclease
VQVVGVDGYVRGWVAIVLEDGRVAEGALFGELAAVLEAFPQAAAVGVDMPIGLPPPWPREADLAAREFVGRRRGSVFFTFPREVLEAPTHAEAVERARSLTGAGLSRQSFALRKKIVEVDALAHDDERLFEVHPEVSFRELAGSPLAFSKRSWNGLTERQRLLRKTGIRLPEISAAGAASPDDVLDAAAAAWSADRYARGRAQPLPRGAETRIGSIWR